MGSIHVLKRSSILALALSLLFTLFLFSLPAADAAGEVSIESCTTDAKSYYTGDRVTVTVNYNNTADEAVNATVNCNSVSKGITLEPGEGTAQAGFSGLPAGSYAVSVLYDGGSYSGPSFTITALEIDVSNVTPSRADPVEVFSGSSIPVSFRYQSNAQTEVDILVGSKVTETLNLAAADEFKKISTNIYLSSLSAGTYNLTLRFEGGKTHTERNAVRITRDLDVNITSPTASKPATVKPGDSFSVKYDYALRDDAAIEVQLKQGDKMISTDSESVAETTPAGASDSRSIAAPSTPGKYDVVVIAKRGSSTYSDKQEDALIVEHKVTANITEPTRSEPFSRYGGEKVTVDFRYTASAKTSVNVKIQNGSSDVLVKSSVSLDKTARSKSKSVTLTIPTGAKLDKYDVVVEAPISGNALDTEREAVLVDAKITAEITSPTKSDPVTVRAGNSVSVKFNYTANMDAEVEVRILKDDDTILASRTVSLDKATRKQGKTVSVSIPSRAAAGKFDVTVNSKYSDKLLSTQSQAVIVKDPVAITIQSPTAADPARFNTAGEFEVKFSYTAEVNSSIKLNVLKPDGKVLVSNTVSLPTTSKTKTKTVKISLPSATGLGLYDLEAVNRNTGNELALEAKAVQVVSYPLGVQVRFVIGRSGCWVNGDYHPVDMAPRIIENRTLLPIRHVGEPLGWQFAWDSGKKMATVIKGEKRVRVWVNNSNAQVSDDSGRTWRTVKIDPANSAVQPALISGRVLLPLRFVSETLNTQVDWNAATRAVTVTQD